MAQGLALLSTANGLQHASLSARDLLELAEYEKIVNFRDEVLAGTHPIVKVPKHVLAARKVAIASGSAVVNTSSRETALVSPDSSALAAPPTTLDAAATLEKRRSPPTRPAQVVAEHVAVASVNAQEVEGGASKDAVSEGSVPYTISEQGRDGHCLEFTAGSAAGNAFKPQASQPEINPILLQKSDELVRAELKLQRLRLERSLREQLEQQTTTKKASALFAESLPAFDVSAVLAKALERVPPSTDEKEATPGSESIDDNTFYSSQHDTPEPSPAPAALDAPSFHRGETTGSAYVHKEPASVPAFPAADTLIGENLAAHDDSGQLITHSVPQDREGSIEDGQIDEEVDTDMAEETAVSSVQEHASQALPRVESLPGHRGPDLAIVAPQPSKPSPLINSQAGTADKILSVQVNHLRNEAAISSSTDSSPRVSKPPQPRLEKKKRKRAKEPVEVDPIQIKVEPRSVSPYEVNARPRPRKYPRMEANQVIDAEYNGPRTARLSSLSTRLPHVTKETRSASDVRAGHTGSHETSVAAVPRYAWEDRGDYGAEGQTFRQPATPRSERYLRASSHAFLEKRPSEGIIYRTLSRASVRPPLDDERSPIMREPTVLPMAPPRQPLRIVVDAYGREYIEPPPPTSIQYSSRPAEIDTYARASVRAPSRMPADVIEQDGVIYRRSSPVSSRVLSNPYPSTAEYRPAALHEPPLHSPSDGFIRIREPDRYSSSRYMEAPMDYIPRATSVRPTTDHVRYEAAPHDHLARYTSVQPELSRRPPTSEIRPGQAMLSDYHGQYQPSSAVPYDGHGFYEAERRPSQIAYIEQPRQRGASVIVYANDGRREPQQPLR